MRRFLRNFSTNPVGSLPPRPTRTTAASAVFEAEREISTLQASTREALLRHDHHAALTSAQSCIEATVELLGKEHVAYAAALNNMAQVHRAAGRPADALPLAEDALRLYETSAGKTHPSTASARANLGLLRVALGTAAKGVARLDHATAAVILLEGALAARREAALGGASKPDAGVGIALYQLASAVALNKDFVRAEKLATEAVLVLKATPGGLQSPATGTALNNLGFLLKSRGAFARADEIYTQALTLRRAVLGEKHADALVTAHNLAECRRAAGDEAGALKIQHEILGIMGHDDDGKNHPASDHDMPPPAINTLLR